MEFWPNFVCFHGIEDERQGSLGFATDIDSAVTGEELDQPSKSSSEDNLLISPSTEEKKSVDGCSAGNCKQVTVADMLCSECKQLLFRPVALNCGHGMLTLSFSIIFYV